MNTLLPLVTLTPFLNIDVEELPSKDFDALMLRWARWVRQDVNQLSKMASNTDIVTQHIRTQIPLSELRNQLYKRRGKRLNDTMNWALDTWCAPAKQTRGGGIAKSAIIETDEIAERVDVAVNEMRSYYNREATNRPKYHGDWLLLALRLHYGASDWQIPSRRSNAALTDELNRWLVKADLYKIRERTAQAWIEKAKCGVRDYLK